MKRLAVAVLLLAVTAVVAARFYLSSSAAAHQVAGVLDSLLHLPVELDSASVGLLGDSSLLGLRVANPDDDSPILTVDSVKADLTALGALVGKLPRSLSLDGVRLSLRFDKSGKLLTRMPEFGSGGKERPMPRIVLRNVRVSLAQDGRPPLTLTSDQLDVAGEGGRVTLEGLINDEAWGEWAVDASLGDGLVTLDLTTKDVAVTPKRLSDLPFVPASVWEQVRLEGRTSGRVTIRFDTATKEIRYRVEASPRDAKLRVPSIDLDTTGTSGEVLVEDGRVGLKNVRATAAQGVIKGDGDLDFRGPGTDMAFRLTVADLTVAQLPRAWQLPLESGRLSGSANLTLKIRDGKLQTGGQGQGTITGVELAGGTGSIGLRLQSDGRRFRFRSDRVEGNRSGRPERAAHEVSGPDQTAYFVRGSSPSLSSWLTNAAGDSLVAMGRVTNRVLRRGADFVEKVASGPAPGEGPTYLEANLSFQDVQLKQLAERLNVALPFPVDGRLSFALSVEVPANTPRDLKAYRLRGTIDVATLQFAGLSFGSTKARLAYRDGVLTLDELAGRMPAPGKPATFTGKARLQVVPLGDVAAQLDIEGFDLAALSRLPAEIRPPVQLAGTARLDLSVSGPLRLEAIQAKGTVRTTDLAVQKLLLGTAEVRYSLQNAILGIDIVRARVYSGEVKGTASVPLRQSDPGELDLTLEEVDVAQAVKALTNTTLPVQGRLSGTVKGTLPVAKADQTRTPRAVVDVNSSQLRIRNVPAERVRGNLRYREGRVEYELEADALGGKVRIDGRLPPARDRKGTSSGRLFGEGRFRVLLRQVEADELLGQFGGPRDYVEGKIDAELRGVSDGEWYGGGMASVAHGKAFGITVSDWRLPLSFRLAPAYGRGELTLADCTAQAGQGRATLRGSMAWAGSGGLRIDGSLRLVEARLSNLVAGLDTYAEGRVTGTVTVAGENVRSANDVRATIQASLKGGRAQQLPVLGKIAPYLTPRGRAATFRDGRLEARLNNGLFRVQKLELNADVIDLFAEGVVTLRGGLDLIVSARTESPAGNPVGLRLLALEVPAIGTVPTVLLVRISALLANRLVRVRVTGTVAHPQVRVEPVRLLTEGALRYFVTRLLGQ